MFILNQLITNVGTYIHSGQSKFLTSLMPSGPAKIDLACKYTGQVKRADDGHWHTEVKMAADHLWQQ